ncbi:MAG: VWA domain-containing protein [Polyangiaceae bacterium]|jgi:hypothetical protein|nr:VWA domain-containing protein [Polyangiaceae bacterium]
MSFVFIGALAAVLLVVAPVAAHLLRVRSADERLFPPAALVPASPPVARRRRWVEHRALLAFRTLAIIALALLGATPLVQCSKLAIGRQSGASVALALVVDDSLSMRVVRAGRSRFEVARAGSLDLVDGAREGDAIAVVLAGYPARVALAPTTDLAAVRDAIEQLTVSDRGTDLDTAMAMAQAAVQDLPQPERRIVLLSDLSDSKPNAPPVGEGLQVPVWAPREGMEGSVNDCAVIAADARGSNVVARVACAGDGAWRGRVLVVRAGDRELARRELAGLFGAEPTTAEITLEPSARDMAPELVELVGPDDDIAHDDRAPVARPVDDLTVAVVSDPAVSAVVTGGAPPAEQALAALQTGARLRPLPAVPDAEDELARYAALVLDDPPGLTPEARTAVLAWLERGGVALVGLGPRAASAPLGATLEPLVSGAPRWVPEAPPGADPTSVAALGPSGPSLVQLAAQGRMLLDMGNPGGETVVRWSDGVPFMIRRTLGRGTAFVVGLPFNADQSDLVIRPAFLGLLSTLVETARTHGGPLRVEAGMPWVIRTTEKVDVRGPAGNVPVMRSDRGVRVVPPEAGRYDLRIDGKTETRFAMVPVREIDFRPRSVANIESGQAFGATRSSVDISRHVALLLLALLAGELVLRALAAGPARKAQTG